MKRMPVLLLICAIVASAICGLYVYKAVARSSSGAQLQSTTEVVAAASDIKLGTILTADKLTTVRIGGTIPKGVLLKRDKAIGRGVIADLYAGEPILENRLAPEGSGGGLAATIRQGMRACAVKVDDVVGVAGFVTPGMRVDVVISGNPDGHLASNQQTQARTLLQNIEVLSAGTNIEKDTEGKPRQVKVVNLLVTPEQAQVLSLASHYAEIQLVLRNPLDTQVAKVQSSALPTLFSEGQAATQRSHATSVKQRITTKPDIITVEVLHGTKRSEQKFVLSGGAQ